MLVFRAKHGQVYFRKVAKNFGQCANLSACEIEHGRFRALFAGSFCSKMQNGRTSPKKQKNEFPAGNTEGRQRPWIAKTNIKTKDPLPQRTQRALRKNGCGSGRRRLCGGLERPAMSWTGWRRKIRS